MLPPVAPAARFVHVDDMPTKLQLVALVAGALATAFQHHPPIAPGAREHVEMVEPAGPLPRDHVVQPPTTLRGHASLAFTVDGALS